MLLVLIIGACPSQSSSDIDMIAEDYHIHPCMGTGTLIISQPSWFTNQRRYLGALNDEDLGAVAAPLPFAAFLFALPLPAYFYQFGSVSRVSLVWPASLHLFGWPEPQQGQRLILVYGRCQGVQYGLIPTGCRTIFQRTFQ